MRKIYVAISVVVLIPVVIVLIWKHSVVKEPVWQRGPIVSADGDRESGVDEAKKTEPDHDMHDTKTNNLSDAKDEYREKPIGEMAIADDEAIAIARKAIGNLAFDEHGEIKIEHVQGIIRVVFPAMGMENPMTRGPEYAAEVHIDAKSGKVLRAVAGG